MGEFDRLLELPGTPQEQAWLRERLETLSVRESYVLAAASRHPPERMEDAVNALQTLDDFEVRLTGSYEELGISTARNLPESVLPYVDFELLGQRYEDEHPGMFVGRCYVEYPKTPSEPAYRGRDAPLPEDDGWSVKLKLASPNLPEGVWLRLPNYDGNMPENSSEVELALDALRVKSLEDCSLLEARCILPEAGNLMEQYSSVRELVRDGGNLGFILEEQGQGEPHWLEKFAAALEYEGCRTLKFALDISQNTRCYEWVPSEGLADFAAEHLRSCRVSEELIRSGAIDLDAYAEDLLETSGYMEASGENGYVRRNTQEFIREFTSEEFRAEQETGMTMQ